MSTATNSEFKTLMESENERMSSGALSANVLKVSQHGVLVDAGLKSPCLIPLAEFEDEPLPRAGDFLACALVSIDYMGQGTLLSREIARRVMGVRILSDAVNSGEIVDAKATGVNKGGVMVNVQGCKGFIPKSLSRGLDLRSVNIGQILPCKVDKVDPQGQKVILTYFPAIDQAASRSRADELASLHEGDLVMAEIKSLTPYGAFCTFGTLSGLLHISQISHERIDDIEKAVKVGDVMELRVLTIDRDKNRISLSRKSLLPKPEKEVAEAN